MTSLLLAAFVPGEPKAEPRPRAVPLMKGGKPVLKAGRPVIVVHRGTSASSWRERVALYAAQHYTAAPTADPVELRLVFKMPRPKSHYRTGKHAGELRPDAPHWHVSTPDGDNLEKAVKDALTGIVWRDDSQVCVTTKAKVYADEEFGVSIQAQSLKATE